MTDAFICDGVRTPIGRYGGALAAVRPDDLAAVPLKALVARNPGVDWAALDDVVMGCTNQAGEDNRNVARMALLLAGLPVAVPGATINRLCGSGMDAVGIAARAIKAGEADVMVAGGVESMSRAPFVMPKAEAAFARQAAIADTTIGWRLVNPLMRELHGIDSMPETAENVAAEFQVSRADQDAFAYRSQQRAKAAAASGRLAAEIVAVRVPQRRGDPVIVDTDEHPRPETTREKLAALPTPFRDGGRITAGNASGVNDGACGLIVASADAAKRHGLEPKARVAGVRHGRRRPAHHGHRPGSGDAKAARPLAPRHRRHGHDRAERGLREPGARGAAPARRRRRRAPRQPQRRRHRARPPPRHERRPARCHRRHGACPDRRPLRAVHPCASASARASPWSWSGCRSSGAYS